MKIKRLADWQVQIAFGSAIVILLVVAAFSYRGIVASQEGARWLAHTHEVRETLQKLQTTIEQVQSSSRAFVLTGAKVYLETFAAGVLRARQLQADVRRLTADNPEQQRQLPGLESLITQKIEFAERVTDLRRRSGLEPAAAAIRAEGGQRMMDDIGAAIDELQATEQRLLTLRTSKAAGRVAESKTVLILGTVLGLLITAAAGWIVQRDISRRRRAEEALKHSEEDYRMLLDGVEDYAIFMLGRQGEIVTWNSGAERTNGYAAHEIIGKNFSCFFCPEEIERGTPDQLLRIAAAKGRYEDQGMRVRKDGSRFLTSSILTALRDPAGELQGFSEICRDISETKEAQAKYRGLLEAAPDAMVVVSQAGEIVLLNVQAEKQFGYRRDELIGQKVTNIIPIGFAERLIADDLRTADDALAQQIGTGIELTALRKDGSEFPIEIMLSPLKSDEGILVTAAIRDISVRTAADRHRAQMEGRYRGLLEAAPDAMVVVDQAGEIVLLNVQAEKQFGYRRDELIGQKITNIIPIGFAERLIADDLRSAEEALAQQIGTGIELTALRKDGSKFPIEIMLSPLKSDEGILVTAAIRDISVRNRQTARVKRLKDEFIATVSHELRTPLTSIAGALSLLSAGSGGKLPKTASQFIEIAYTNSKRLVRLINDILDIEKIEAGKFELVLEPVDIHSVLEQAMEDTQAYAKSHRVRIRIEASPRLSEVQSDPDWLVQIVTNLLANAIKFSPPDGEVVLAAAMRGGLTQISVRDHGPGVPADFKPQIFEKFAQADGSDTRQKGGTGLGLSIVKQMVTRLGGEVGFDDAPGGGAIFHVDLPGAPPADKPSQQRAFGIAEGRTGSGLRGEAVRSGS